jgi:hypothetical protein
MKALIKTLWFSSLTALCSLSFFSARAFVPDDVHWDPQFGVPGTTNSIAAIALNDGNIYASGFGSTSPTLKYFDGGQWNTIALFTNSPGAATVYDMAFAGNTLYAAGAFNRVNGIPVNGLAQWNGSTWSGVGFNTGTVLSLAVSGANLYVGGLFTNLDSSGVIMTNIGMWDGGAWHALGDGLGLPNTAIVRSLAVSGGLVYAGGLFTNSGSQIISNVAVWNGSTWSGLGAGVNNSVNAVAASGGNVYVGGNLSQAGGVPVNFIAQWNGSSWSALGSGLSGAASGIGIFNNLVCVAGGFATAGGVTVSNFAIWNGSAWSAAGIGLSASANRVVGTSSNVFVGGTFALANGVFVEGITSWDGTQFTAYGTPGRMNGIDGFVNALASDGTNWYAGGQYAATGLMTNIDIARFDGADWHSMGSGVVQSSGLTEVLSMAATNGQVYIGGSFTYVGNAVCENVGRWDGANWNSMGSGPGGVVASLTARPDGIYAAGAQWTGSAYQGPFLERWDGTNWDGVLAYNQTNTFIDFYLSDPNIGMDAVAFLGTNIFVGGHFLISWHDQNFNGYTCSNIMRFDGAYGETMNTGLNSNVLCMSVLGSNLYVGGYFTVADSNAASHIAMWDGANWHPVGGGVVGTGFVGAMTTMGNALYVAGSFTNMGGVSANHLAKWDGTNWTPLGSGVTGRITGVSAVASCGSDLFIGGNMHTVGIADSYSIAHWNSQVNFAIPELRDPAQPAPGQFQAWLFGVNTLTNIVQASTNLMIWAPVFTNTSGVVPFTDTTLSYPSHFYRVVLAP